MPTSGFLDIQGIRKMLTVPSYVFDDKRVSLGAKGLYVQLYYSSKELNTIADVAKHSSTSVEEAEAYFKELAQLGYLEFNKDKPCKLITQPPKSKVDASVTEKAQEYAQKEQPKKLNAFEQMVEMVNKYPDSQIPYDVKQALITYFTLRLQRQGRFATGDPLHAFTVAKMIGDLNSFHLSPEGMIDCIQQSIDRGWFGFFKPNTTKFDKTAIVSGSYTEEDVENIRQRAKELEQRGEQGVF